MFYKSNPVQILQFLFNSSVETQQLGFRRIEHGFSDLNSLLRWGYTPISVEF